jgi:hypothetical protein
MKIGLATSLAVVINLGFCPRNKFNTESGTAVRSKRYFHKSVVDPTSEYVRKRNKRGTTRRTIRRIMAELKDATGFLENSMPLQMTRPDKTKKMGTAVCGPRISLKLMD